MSQISYAIRHAPHSQWLFRWQATVIVAISGGSLTFALFNLSALKAGDDECLQQARIRALQTKAALRFM